MARRSTDRTGNQIEAIVKITFGLLILLALGIGGITNFVPVLLWLIKWLVVLGAGVAVLTLLGLVLVGRYKKANTTAAIGQAAPQEAGPSTAPSSPGPSSLLRRHRPTWTPTSIREALNEIDWYQFEKFCAALLHADGFTVERKGGAQPDGGVDLIVEQQGARGLIQCKQWRTWRVQEKTVREMLGSMAHFGARQGAIYTLKGWTEPAAKFAALHNIELVDGEHLAKSAATLIPASTLQEILRTDIHHCPKCEAPMALRSGAFGQFWGCTRYPACRGKLKHSGAI